MIPKLASVDTKLEIPTNTSASMLTPPVIFMRQPRSFYILLPSSSIWS